MNEPVQRPALRAQALQILCVSLAMMMFEINLVRLFSVVMQHHLAFFVLAIALFGIGLGGLYAQLLRQRAGNREGTPPFLHFLPICLAVALVSAMLILLVLPLNVEESPFQVPRVRWLLCAFLAATSPFFFGSMFMSMMFASRPQDAGRLYFSDLVGAGAGCLLVVPALQWLGGLTAPFAIAMVAVLPAFWGPAAGRRLRNGLAALVLIGAACAGAANLKYDFTTKMSGGSLLGEECLFSEWNFYSRIDVRECPWWKGWRLSEKYDGPIPEHRMISQDGRAPAYMVQFDGDYEKVRYLRYDVSAMPYRIADPKSMMVIGAGGGRDILTARMYGVPLIKGVELNPIIARDVRAAFRDFTGDPLGFEGVALAVANGRTYAHQDTNTYDLIVTALADTQTANSQGASVLSENHLYTAEAFASYFDRLSPSGMCGMISTTLWDDHLLPRIMNTMRVALKAKGIAQPAKHMIAVITPMTDKTTNGMYVAFSRSPITDDAVRRAARSCAELGYELAWPPTQPVNDWSKTLARLFDAKARAAYLAESMYDLSPLTDDRPYLWYAVKPGNFLGLLANPGGNAEKYPIQLRTLHMLMDLFLVAFGCVLVLMLAPLLVFRRSELGQGGGQAVFLTIFFLLGVAYVLIEIALLQNFFLLLGSPTLTFAVLLSAMLIFTGVGSFLSSRFSTERLQQTITAAACVVVAIQLVAMLVVPRLTDAALSAGLPAKFALVAALLAVVATPMGMLFPSAIRLIGHRGLNMTCWAWGINGVGSVLGSVGATMISMNLGIRAMFAAGILCYGLVALVSLLLSRNPERV